MSADRIVVFDLETGGILRHQPNIQLAAIAIDRAYNELEAFNCKIKFNEADADPEALALNHYQRETWEREAIPVHRAVDTFADFLGRHKCIEMTSKRTGAPYSIALLASYNSAFDGQRIKDMFDQRFLPAHPRVLCIMQRVLWFAQETGFRPADYKLTTVAKELGCEEQDAHDALADVRMSIGILRSIKSGVWQEVAA